MYHSYYYSFPSNFCSSRANSSLLQNPCSRAFLNFLLTSGHKSGISLATQTIFILLTLCGSFGGSGTMESKAEVRMPSSSPPSTISNSIYYETSETTTFENQRLVEQSSPKTTKVNVKEVFFDLPTKSSPPTMAMTPANVTDVVVHRFIRQIVPLPKPTSKPSKSYGVGGILTISPDTAKLIKLYQEFLTDYAIKKEWYSAKVIVPQQVSLKLCQFFTVSVLLSEATLTRLDCYNESQIPEMIKSDLRQPIIVAAFLAKSRAIGGGDSEASNISPIDSRLLLKTKKVLLLTRNESVEEIVNTVQPESLINYRWTLARMQNDFLELYKVYGFATSLNPLFQRIGTWSGAEGLQIDAAKDTGLENFQKQMLRVTTVSGPPVVNLDRPEFSYEPTALNVTGYLPDLLELLSLVLNFTYQFRTPNDGKFGDNDGQGNWSGMVGQLQRNEADIALHSFSLTKSRLSVMEFSPPVEYSSTKLLIRRDWQSAELKLDAFIRPFEWKVWITILLLICLGTITLIIFTSFRLFKATPGESMWLLSTCFLLQGQSEHSTIRVTPFRIASGTFWMLAVFIFACYTARLTSFLAADTDKLPVKNLNEAVRSRSWKIGLVKGSSFLEKVKESKSQEMTLLWKRLQDDTSVLVNGFPDGIAKVYKERYIFFTSESIPTFMVKGNCSFSWLPGKYFPGFGYMGYQKGLPYAATISHKISKIRETGLMRRTFKKWWGTTSNCDARSGSDAFTAISLHETGSAFLILMVGASIAVACGILEFIFSVHRKRWHNHLGEIRTPSPNEFAAPVVQGNAASMLPFMLHTDRPFIWRVQETTQSNPGHKSYLNFDNRKSLLQYDTRQVKI